MSLPPAPPSSPVERNADGVPDRCCMPSTRDHMRGPCRATVTVLGYGDYEGRSCGPAEPVIRELLRGLDDVREVWRHLLLTDVHMHAQIAAEAAEAAAAQGFYWQMHDLAHQGSLHPGDPIRYAAEIGPNIERFEHDPCTRAGAAGVGGSQRCGRDTHVLCKRPGSLFQVFGNSRPLVGASSLPLYEVTILDFDLMEISKSEDFDDIIQMGGNPQDHVILGNSAGAVQRRAVHHDVQALRR